jgi:hypothetical protein
MSWWNRLRSKIPTPAGRASPPTTDDGQYYIAPRNESETRAEAALPGTADIPTMLELVPPPINPALAPDHRPNRDYAPDPIANYTVEWPAAKPFRRDSFRAALPVPMVRFGCPSMYARLPSGRVTFLSSSSDGEFEPEATAIIAAWDFSSEATTASSIGTCVAAMSAWMATRPESFGAAEPDNIKLQQRWDHAQAIIAVRPQHVAILAKPRHAAFDGRTVWRTLHSTGITWGDMDQFQWADPTNQSDYLFWAEVDDGDIGYALPEKIADGTQHFHRVRFIFEVARSPAPQHVLGQMRRAAEAFAAAMGCELIFSIDHVQVVGMADLEAAVAECILGLEKLRVSPGSTSVCQLR